MANETDPTHYESLGVPPDADVNALRAAYRDLARQLHPDLGYVDDGAMAEINNAWSVLSDPLRRSAYDERLRYWPGPSRTSPTPTPTPSPSPTATPTVTPTPSASPQYGIRRHAWIGGIQLQIRRLGTQAARSAVQTLLLRHPGIPRAEYEALVEPIVKYLLTDTEDRVRLARQAGASPLDLAIGAALLGLHSLAEDLCARCRTPESRLQGEMVDRMWDTMCHEIPRDLAQSLGGNPRISRRLRLE